MSCLSLLVALSLHVGLDGNYNNVHPHARCQRHKAKETRPVIACLKPLDKHGDHGTNCMI